MGPAPQFRRRGVGYGDFEEWLLSVKRPTDSQRAAAPNGLDRRQALGGMVLFSLGVSLHGSSFAAPLAQSRIDPFVYPEAFGAIGDGTTDDAAALRDALKTGRRVWIDPAKTYAFGSQLAPPTNGGCVGGGQLLMLTSVGKFDRADYGGNFWEDAGIFLSNVSNVRIEARITMQGNAGIRTCYAIFATGCTNVELDVDCSGFKEARCGIIDWNSCSGGVVKAYIHDIRTNNDTLPSMQISGLSVDNYRAGGVNSRGMRFDVRAKDIIMGPAAIARHGYQTDAVNLQGQGHAGHSGRIVAENVHEPLDVFSDYNSVEVVARDCLFGVKLVHGASHNLVRAKVDRFMKNALVYGGSNGTQGTSYNRCIIEATGGGEIGAFGDVAAVGFDDGKAVHAPRQNYTEVTARGNGVDLDYIALIGSGSNNTTVVKGSGFSVSASRIASSAGPGNVIMN